MKRASLNLILAVVLIGLGVAVYFSQKQKPVKASPPLTSLNAATIQSIAVDVPDHKPIKLERGKDGRWALTGPVQARADQNEVNGLLEVATSPCQESLNTQNVKLADFGLKPPKYVLHFDKTTIDVGEVEPLKYRRYVKLGDRICLVSDPTTSAASGDYSNLVSKTLVAAGRVITGIELPDRTLTRSDDGKSWTVKPADPKAADNAAQKLVDAWSSAVADWNKPMVQGVPTSKNAETVTLQFKDGQPQQFVIEKRKPQLILERADIGVRFALSKQDAQTLLTLARAPSKTPAVTSSARHPAMPGMSPGKSK